MAYFAKINSETHVVLEVNAVSNDDIQNLTFPDSEPIGIQFLEKWNTPGTYWKQTSFNKNFRKNFAGIGSRYDQELDAFVPQQPFPSWVLNKEDCIWYAPISYPQDGKIYDWNEQSLSWVEMTIDS